MIADIIRDTKHCLLLSDSAAWLAACLVVFLGTRILFGPSFFPGGALSVYAVLLALWVLSLAVIGCYRPKTGVHAAANLFSGSALFVGLGVVVDARGEHLRDVLILALIAALGVGFALLFRTWLPWRIRRWVRSKAYETVLVLGHDGLAEAGVARLRQRLRVAAIQAPFPQGASVGDGLATLITSSGAKEVLCVAADAPPHALESVKEFCQRNQVGWQLVPSRDEFDEREFESLSLDGVPLMGPRSSSITGFNRLYKALFDLCFGLILLTITMPFMILIGIAIRLTSSGPAILAQQRVGRGGTLFTMYKFRTMYENTNDKRHREYVQNWMKNRAHTESNGQKIFKITNDDRITPLGRFLRRYSLDELPQILNVLKLDMSIVGPRPAMPYELEGYLPWHLKRLDGPPGLTGPWQVNGRNHLSFDEMVQLDVGYLQNWSPVRDLILIARTVPAMLFGKGH